MLSYWLFSEIDYRTGDTMTFSSPGALPRRAVARRAPLPDDAEREARAQRARPRNLRARSETLWRKVPLCAAKNLNG